MTRVAAPLPRLRAAGFERWFAKLADGLESSGYGEFVNSFNPLAPRPHEWRRRRADAPWELRPLLDLFLFGRSAKLAELGHPVAEAVLALQDVGLVAVGNADEDACLCGGLILMPVFGQWLLFQTPQINPLAYFGDDSIALLSRLRPRVGDNALDLCSGPGVQALHCSGAAATVTAVEVQPFVADLARCNMALNRRFNVDVLCGDLYAAVPGRKFDLIVANPPLLPFCDDISYPFVGHGGRDGMKITWRILEGLPDALSHRGRAQMIGSCFSDGLLPLPTPQLAHFAETERLRIVMSVASHQALSPGTLFFEGLVHTAAHASGLPCDEVSGAFQRLLEEQAASHLCTYALHVAVANRGTFVIQDVSNEPPGGLWYG